MSMLEPPYELPDLRPFRTIQNRMRLQGGAVVTEHGTLRSDDYQAGVAGWSIDGDGDAEFNNGTFRGTVVADSFEGAADGANLLANGTFDVDTSSWAASPFYANSAIARVTSPVFAGAGALQITNSVAPGNCAALSELITASPGDVFHARCFVRKEALNANPDNNKIYLEVLFFPTGLITEASQIGFIQRQEVSVAADVWTEIEVYAQAPDATDRVQIRVLGHFDTGQEIYLDIVSLTVPSRIVVPHMVTEEDMTEEPRVWIQTNGLHFNEAFSQGLFFQGTDLLLKGSPVGHNRGHLRFPPGLAAEMHAEFDEIYLGDNAIEDILGAWVAYTPSNLGITLGDGDLAGYYMLIGKTCWFRWRLIWGSTTAFTGNVSIGLPFTSKGVETPIAGTATDSGTRNYVCVGRIQSGDADRAIAVTTETAGGAADGIIDATNPFTWTNNDRLGFAGVYEIL